MPKYKIAGNYGFCGTDWEEEIEAENQAEADKIAWQVACEKVDCYAEEITSDENQQLRPAQ